MLVAEGAVDIAAEVGLSIWDAAALIPIVIEAGGRFDSVEAGAPGGSVSLSTNGLLHDDAIKILRG
jgi:histidinol-phosphatase